MKRINRALAGILAIVMMAVAAPMAKAEEVGVAVEYPADYATYSGTESLDALVDMDSLEALLHNGLSNCQSSIDISSYGLKVSQISLLSDLIYNEMYEIFHIDQYSYTYNTQTLKVSKIKPTYNCTLSVYRERLAMVESARDEILEGIIGNDDLSQVEKALLIHDRISMVCDYDYSFGEHRGGIYGVLVLGTAVCQGYAEAYAYLLEAVGMESFLCVSDALNHAWNIIKIGNEWYHVDVTWDDTAWDDGMRGAEGAVGHKYFLLSSAEFYKSHIATDYDTIPDDTTYDSYFWQDSRAAFHLVGDEIYYIDHLAETLNRYSDRRALLSVADQWISSHGLWQNYARLTTDGEHLYYNIAKKIYKYEIETDTSTVIFEPSLAQYYNIYGLIYEDGYLICDINDTPPCSAYNKDGLYQLKEKYSSDMIPPTATISSTNYLSESQNVRLRFTDEKGIAGYYWGTSSNYLNNSYTATTEELASKTIAAPGTYYLVAKDINGNLSEAVSITFYQTTLDGSGAAVEPVSVLTEAGKSFSFPAVQKEGYIYRGWAENSSAIAGLQSLIPTKNSTYYAIFERIVVSSVEIIEEPDKQHYYIGDALDTSGLKLRVTFSDQSSKEITSGFSVDGFSSASAGEKRIMVTYEGAYDIYSVMVEAPALALSVTHKEIGRAENLLITATSTPADQVIGWSSSDPAVATVVDGMVVGKGEGEAEITASFMYNGILYSRVCTIKVVNRLLPGDANSNHEIDTGDAVLILRHLLEEISLEADIGDYNGDGQVRISDAVMILRYLLN